MPNEGKFARKAAYKHTHTHTHTHTHPRAPARTHARAHPHIRTPAHAHTHTRTYAHPAHAHTHTQTHTHTHTHRRAQKRAKMRKTSHSAKTHAIPKSGMPPQPPRGICSNHSSIFKSDAKITVTPNRILSYLAWELYESGTEKVMITQHCGKLAQLQI